MKEIKFRVWDNKHKEWIGNFEIIDGIPLWVGDYGKLVGRGKKKRRKGHFGELIFMQFTGLKDKNGKVIYDGDILDNKPQMIKVCWGSIGGKWFGHFVDKKRTSSFWMGDEFKNYEIIGNIYENPELTKPSPKSKGR